MNVSYPLFKFLRPEHCRSLAQRGEVRIGTLYEYRNAETYSGKTHDGGEGKRRLTLKGGRVESAADLRRLGFRVEGDGMITVREDWRFDQGMQDCHVYCTSGAFYTSTLDQAREEGKTACALITDPRAFFEALAHHEQLRKLYTVSPCVYAERHVVIPLSQPLSARTLWDVPPALMKPPPYADQKEVRALWEPEAGAAVSPLVVTIPEVAKLVIPLTFDGVDSEAVKGHRGPLRVGARIIRGGKEDSHFSTLIPRQVFTAVMLNAEEYKCIGFKAEDMGNLLEGAVINNCVIGTMFHHTGTIFGVMDIEGIDEIQYFTEPAG